MKKIFFIIALIGVTFGCSANDFRYRNNYRYSGNDYYQNHDSQYRHFWRQVERRLLNQHHRINENLEHGYLSHHHAHKLFRHLSKLENRLEELRCENDARPHLRRKILRYLDKNEQRINSYLNLRHRKPHRRKHAENPYRYNDYMPSRGIQWSLGGSTGVFYFGY